MAKRRSPRRNLSQRSELLFDTHEYHVHTDTRELFLHSDTGNCEEDVEIGIDYRVANSFIKGMTFLEHQGSDPILIHVCSVGGDWEYGLAIFDRIAMSPCVVTTLSYAHARSMSSILIQAADYRVLSPNCDVLVHFGKVCYPEDRLEHVIAEADWVKQQNIRMLEIYAARCAKGPFFKRKKYGRAGVANFLQRKIRDSAEWYMDGRTAIDFGLVDAILGDPGFETLAELRGT